MVGTSAGIFDQGNYIRRFTFDIQNVNTTETDVRFLFTPGAVGTYTPEAGKLWTVNKVYVNAYGANGVLCDESNNNLGGVVNSTILGTAIWTSKQYRILRGNQSFSGVLVDNILLIPEENSTTPPVFTIQGLTEYGSILNDDFFYTFKLSPGAKIVVAPGAGFKPENVIFTSVCSELSDGIYVEGNGSLKAQKVFFKNSRFGVKAAPNAKLAFKNCDFENNYIGLNLDMGEPGSVKFGAFSNVRFSNTGTLNIAYPGMPETVGNKGYCGIYANNYNNLNLWGGNSNNATFSGLCNGIVGNNVTGNFHNMVFTNIDGTGNPYPNLGYGIKLASPGNVSFVRINEPWTSMTFTNCKKPINLTGYAGSIKKVTIEKAETGILWENSQNRDIVMENNTINASRTGIEAFFNEPLRTGSMISKNSITVENAAVSTTTSTGIRIEEMGTGKYGWRVTNNPIKMYGGTGIAYLSGKWGYLEGNKIENLDANLAFKGILASDHANTGIYTSKITGAGFNKSAAIYSESGFTNVVMCNCIDNTEVGLQFYDMADFSFVSGNQINTHNVGLRLGDDNQSNVYIGVQRHEGNLWDLSQYSGNNGNFGGVHKGSLPIIPFSQFIVDGIANSNYYPIVDPSEIWFTDLPANGNTFMCGIDQCAGGNLIPPTRSEGDLPSELDAAIVSNTLPTDGYDIETKWKGKYRLYRRLLRKPALESYSSAYAAFKTANINQPVGQLAYIAEQRAALYDLSASQSSNIDAYRTTLQQQARSIFELDSLKLSGAQINDQQYDAQAQQLANQQNQYVNYVSAIRTARQLQIQNLRQLNNAVTPDQQPATNQKTVNNIVFNLMTTDQITDAEIATLQTVANQCPLAGGDAVYEARALVQHFTGIQYDDTQLCQNANDRHNPEQALSSEASNFLVYPNPASGQLNWAPFAGNEICTIRLINALGQLILEKQSSNAFLDVQNVPEGMYVLQIVTQGVHPEYFRASVSILH